MLISLDERFARRAGSAFVNVANAVPEGGVPHHSFHVFAVYPWLGLLRSGMRGPALDVIDRCRVRWGRVLSVDEDMAVVRTPRLAFENDRLRLTGATDVHVRRFVSQGEGEDTPKVGDLVSVHWDWICETLTPVRARRLIRYTIGNLDAVNALSLPGPAIAASASGG